MDMNTTACCAKLNAQKAEVDKFKEETDSKFSNVDKQLKAQKTTVDQKKADIDTLKSVTAGLKMGSTEQNKLKLEVNRNKSEVNAKVAFSATVIDSPGVFTGPPTTSNVLIFTRVFTDIGNAYNSKTGIFTAPLKGVYHFSFMTFGYNSHTSGAILVKNRHYQVRTWEFKGPDASDSNAVILELNVRECQHHPVARRKNTYKCLQWVPRLPIIIDF